MADFTRELFLQALDEWGRYPGAFRKPARGRADNLPSRSRAMPPCVTCWRTLPCGGRRGAAIIDDTIKNGDKRPRSTTWTCSTRRPLQRFQEHCPKPNSLAWYEAERQRMVDVVSSLHSGTARRPARCGTGSTPCCSCTSRSTASMRRASWWSISAARVGGLRAEYAGADARGAGGVSAEAGLCPIPGRACPHPGVVGAGHWRDRGGLF